LRGAQDPPLTVRTAPPYRSIGRGCRSYGLPGLRGEEVLLLRVVAGARVVASAELQRGLLDLADLRGLPAPGAEAAAARRVHRAGDVAAEADAGAAGARRGVGHRHGREQRLRVRVGRAPVDLLLRAEL